jgi:Tol biopolymer transport system component
VVRFVIFAGEAKQFTGTVSKLRVNAVHSNTSCVLQQPIFRTPEHKKGEIKMKNRTLLTIFTAVTLLAMTPAFTLSQLKGVIPDAQTSVSDFSMPQDVGEPINSVDNEAAPFIASTGLSLYFASGRVGGYGSMDIWVCQRPTLTSAWGAPQNLGAVINTDGIDNQPALSADGLTLFFNNSSRTVRFGGADIYVSTRTDIHNDFGWTEPINLGGNINTSSNEISAAYFEPADGGTPILYFSSDRSGNIDIYQSKRSPNGKFNPPTNVTALNSSGNEDGPSISRNGLEMLFSSDREPGFGGRDIWVSTRASVNAQWGSPADLTSVNSEYDDSHPSHSLDGTVIYFGSGRDGGSGSGDIYTAHRLCTSSK